MDRWIGAATAVMWALNLNVVMKGTSARRQSFLFMFKPSPISHKLWVVTERIRSCIQVAEIRVLQRVVALSLSNRVRNSDIQRELGVELLFALEGVS